MTLIEKREYYLCTNLDWLTENDERITLNGVGILRSERTIKNRQEIG